MIFNLSNNDQNLITAPENLINPTNVKVKTISKSKNDKYMRFYVSGVKMEYPFIKFYYLIFKNLTSNEDFINFASVKKIMIVGYESSNPSSKFSVHPSI
jgi:hypothetical protein